MSESGARRVSRRQAIRLLGLGSVGLYALACSSQAAPSSPQPTQGSAPTAAAKAAEPTAAKPAAQPTGAAKPTAAPGAAFNWKAHEGKQVRFVGLKSGMEQFWMTEVPAFEEKTGIKVVFEDYEQAQGRQKIATELTARTGTLDTFRVTKMQDFAQFSRNGWLEVLDPYLADAAKTDPAYDFADHLAGTVEACKVDGKVVALPVTSGSQILFYRKDLFEAKGLKPPTTLAELEEAARALHNPPEVYGFVSRGQRSAAVSMFAAFLHNFGADWMAGGKPSLNTPEALEAYTFYANLLKNYGPPGIQNMSHVELTPLFAEGKAAMYTDDPVNGSIFEDPAKSKVVGKVGYAKFPAGPKRDTP
ncbi:MAG TPA: sugar ABC transporter substrate-binding protein, partial [Chloroflexota bacterium]